MSGHTPGPWTGFLGGHLRDAAWLIGPIGARPIVAEVFRDEEDDVSVSGAEVEANARLIAAAPDLLEALRAILEDTEAHISDSDRDDGWSAIGKAEAG